MIAVRSRVAFVLEADEADVDVEDEDEVTLELLSNEVLLKSPTRSLSRTPEEGLRSSLDRPSDDRRGFDLSVTSVEWLESLLGKTLPPGPGEFPSFARVGIVLPPGGLAAVAGVGSVEGLRPGGSLELFSLDSLTPVGVFGGWREETELGPEFGFGCPGLLALTGGCSSDELSPWLNPWLHIGVAFTLALVLVLTLALALTLALTAARFSGFLPRSVGRSRSSRNR